MGLVIGTTSTLLGSAALEGRQKEAYRGVSQPQLKAGSKSRARSRSRYSTTYSIGVIKLRVGSKARCLG